MKIHHLLYLLYLLYYSDVHLIFQSTSIFYLKFLCRRDIVNAALQKPFTTFNVILSSVPLFIVFISLRFDDLIADWLDIAPFARQFSIKI